MNKLDGGYLLIDNRNNEGVSEKQVVDAGLPLVARSGLFEAATITCNHCNAIVVINPDRTRARGFCVKCNSYICDNCYGILHATGVCRTMTQILDELQETAERQSIILGV